VRSSARSSTPSTVSPPLPLPDAPQRHVGLDALALARHTSLAFSPGRQQRDGRHQTPVAVDRLARALDHDVSWRAAQPRRPASPARPR
jgi:hypothetical protein